MNRTAETQSPAWHTMEGKTVLSSLDAQERGLSGEEAARRLAEDGPNRLPEASRTGTVMRFLRQFHNLLIYVLLAAALLSLLLGHRVDAAVILAVVLVNAIIGFVQEGRAEQALAAIKSMIDPHCTVLRDGRRTTIPANQAVRGDIVLVEAGDRIPADLRLLEERNLKIDEAILTGESIPVEKSPAPVAEDAALGSREGMAYSGTFVASGQARGVVVATGPQTELGKIGRLIGSVESLKTPLLRQMDRFARQLTVVILAVVALTFAYAYAFGGYAPQEAFMVMVGLAVAAIPEGLPAIMTITLAIGVRRMATRNAIIRRLPAVETLGSVSVICSDKTGTLTRNEMTARSVKTVDARLEVGGVGYAPEGDIRPSDDGDKPDVSRGTLATLLRAAVLCNDAELRQTNGGWISDGDPMEGALVALVMKAGIDGAKLRNDLPRVDEIPFESAHRFMATLHREGEDTFAFIKGAPERVLEMCGRESGDDGDRPLDREAWEQTTERLAGEGQRMLAFAVKRFPRDQSGLSPGDVEEDAVFLGCVGFIDPPRAEAAEAVRECADAGIRVVMITGDHAATAREIGRQLGLAERPQVVTGAELEKLDDERFHDAARRTAVFARTTPEHKLRLVRALQADGLTVAMTGDGVNDSPALKRADVGVAMGRKGTEAAKQAAEMVLADDNFASIVAAVKEGRTVYDNLMKVIAWTLPTNGGESMTILAAIALGLALPVTPVQILWINMVTAVALGLTLAFEPAEPQVMRRPPRPADRPILTGEIVWRVVFVSTLFMIGAFGMFFWAEAREAEVEEARTLVVNTIVAMEIFYLFSVRYAHATSFTWQGVFGTPAVLTGVGIVVAAQLVFTYVPAMNAVFETRPLEMAEIVAVTAVGVALLVVVETEKWIRRALVRHEWRPRPASAARR